MVGFEESRGWRGWCAMTSHARGRGGGICGCATGGETWTLGFGCFQSHRKSLFGHYNDRRIIARTTIGTPQTTYDAARRLRHASGEQPSATPPRRPLLSRRWQKPPALMHAIARFRSTSLKSPTSDRRHHRPRNRAMATAMDNNLPHKADSPTTWPTSAAS